MKLCLIYNVWADWDWFDKSFYRMSPLVDGVICVWSERSNYGEISRIPLYQFQKYCDFVNCEPVGEPRESETNKRNAGLDRARELGYTHFLTMDADELYQADEFLREIPRFWNSNLAGLVCRVKCYFKSTTLTIGYDTTLVPFIHRLDKNTRHEFNRNYPFAWTKTNGVPFTREKQIRIDPTRSLNINDGVEWSDITMHHFSWVRSDIKKKIRNSTAKENIERSSVVRDYSNAKEGYYCEFYRKPLQVTPNIFGLPEINDTTIRFTTSAGQNSTD